MTPFRTTLSAASAFALLYAGAWVVAPDHARSATRLATERLDVLFAPDSAKEPVSCLRRKEAELKALALAIETSRRSLDAGITAAADQSNMLRMQSQKTRAYLDLGRQALATPAGQQIVFAGYIYPTREALERQLQLTFEEERKITAQAGEAERLLNSLMEAQRKIVSRRTEIRSQIEMMPGKIALAEAQATYAAIETDLAEIDRILAQGAETQSTVNPLLRTVDELQASEAVQPSVDAAFQAWLQSSAPAPAIR